MSMFVLAWWHIAIIFVLGIAVGGLAQRFLGRKHNENTAQQMAAEKELTTYENAVHQHLMQTTELMQQLGADYQHIVDHLRQGIHELGKSTYEGHNIIPHFPGTHHSTLHTHAETHVTMPKTYIDPNKPH